MSENKAQAYLDSLDDDAFEALFEGKDNASFEEIVASVKQAGEAAGYQFSEVEMSAELKAALEDDGELSESQLEGVAGGTNTNTLVDTTDGRESSGGRRSRRTRRTRRR